MKRSAGVLGLGLALAASVAPAHALQADPFAPPDPLRYLRWGPLRVRPGFAVTELGHDDNVFFRSASEPKEGDLRVTLSPRLEGLVLFGQRAFVTFRGQVDYTAYRRFRDQNFFNRQLEARASVPFGRVAVFADLLADRRRDRPTSEFDSRLERDNFGTALGVALKLGSRTRAQLALRRTDRSFTDPDLPRVGALLDRLERGLETTLAYTWTEQTTLLVEFSTLRVRFDDPSVARDSRQRDLIPGIRFGERSRLGGLLRLGRTRIDLDDPAKRDFSGVVGELDLRYRFGRGTTVRLEGERRAGFAVFESNNLFLDRSAGVRVIHFFNRVLGAETAVRRGRLSFPGAGSVADRLDRIRSRELGVRWRVQQSGLGERVEYSLRWVEWERDTNPPFDHLDQTRSTLDFGASFGF